MKHFPVKDSEEFLRFFDPDLNPEIDITKLWSDSPHKAPLSVLILKLNIFFA